MAYDSGLAKRGSEAYNKAYATVVKGEAEAQRRKRASDAREGVTKTYYNVGSKVENKVKQKGTIGISYKK